MAYEATPQAALQLIGFLVQQQTELGAQSKALPPQEKKAVQGPIDALRPRLAALPRCDVPPPAVPPKAPVAAPQIRFPAQAVAKQFAMPLDPVAFQERVRQNQERVRQQIMQTQQQMMHATVAMVTPHPHTQLAALADVLAEVGWAGACSYNERTGRMIDGHARKRIARAQGYQRIPVLVGSLDEDTERKILATLDSIGAMAQADTAKLEALLGEVHTGSAALTGLYFSQASSG